LTRPYQTVPTQWSNHIETEDGQVLHHEFLSTDPRDSRSDLIEALLESVGGEGSICVYSPYERAILEALADAFPKFAGDLRRVTERLWDLLPVVRGQYYHPGFQGSFSIKAVLPALLPELGYDDLEIREGGVAAQVYGRMVFEETDWVEKLRLREALLRYCERDTLAMLRLRHVLLEKARSLKG
jgi:predicted RecB family nuclease